VNCGAIPTNLFESEVFGHKRGAFTDARTSAPGLISAAEGGTVFLDEVDAIPLLAQVKLLHFLQDKVYRPLGAASSSERMCGSLQQRILSWRPRSRQGNFGRTSTTGSISSHWDYRRSGATTGHPLLARYFLNSTPA